MKFFDTIKNNIKRIYKKIQGYISTNKLFLMYTLLSLISTSLLRYYTVGKFFVLKPMMTDLALILLIGSFGYLIKPKKQFYYYLGCLLFYTIINVINSIYYTFYISYVSVSLLSSLGQAGEVGDSIVEKLQYFHFVFLIFPIIYVVYHKIITKANYINYVTKIERSKKMLMSTFIASFFLICSVAVTITNSEASQIAKQWSREFIVEKFGVVFYQMNDLVQSVIPKINTLFGYDEAAREFREYYANKETTVTKNKYTNVFKGKNVVFVHMESVQGFALDLQVNGKEVTPNLNQLKEEGLYFNNFYPQIGVGTSSDTEFTLATSLMPVLSGTVFVSYPDREYESIFKLLKEENYYTFSMHANKSSMWNRAMMYPSLGYDTFYSKSYYTIDDTIGLGLSDKSFYKQIIPIMEGIEQENKNYVGTVISLSNHSPFSDIEKYGEFDLTAVISKYNEDTQNEEIIEDRYLEDSKLGNYLKSLHYADEALGEFLELINNSEYFNNTVFIFYGDHDARLSSSEFDNLYNYDPILGDLRSEEDPLYYDYNDYVHQLNKKTPLIIWTKDNKYVETYNYPMGMIDILPTVANMMGFTCKYCLGNDIFTIKNNNTIIFTNGNFLTNKIYYNSSKESYYLLTQDDVDEDYIKTHQDYTDQILELSNNIIVYNLLKTEETNLKEVTNES